MKILLDETGGTPFFLFPLGLRLVPSSRSNPALKQAVGKTRFLQSKIFDCGIKSAAVYAAKAKILLQNRRPAGACGGADLVLPPACQDIREVSREGRAFTAMENGGFVWWRVADGGVASQVEHSVTGMATSATAAARLHTNALQGAGLQGTRKRAPVWFGQ